MFFIIIIEAVPLINLHKFRDSHIKLPFQSNNDYLEYNEAAIVQSLDPCDPDV